MRTFFVTIILILISGSCFSKPMTSEDFIYSEVYECGEKRDFLDTTLLSSNYYIHFDENDNVVILNNGNQYKSFETTIKSQLYYQNGGEHSLKFNQNNNVYIFELIKREYQKPLKGKFFTQTLIFDKNQLTYQSQSSRQDSNGETYIVYDDYRKTGFCSIPKFLK